MKSNQPSKTLRRFFSGLAEQTFQTHLGVADTALIDYISDMLIRFVRFEALHRVRNLNGRPIEEIAQLLNEAEARVGDARREVHRHIGDFTLFWAGLYPESLRPRGRDSEVDRYGVYCAQGKRAYLIASTIRSSHERQAPSELLQRLSHEFEMCAYGLREVRREWERRDDDEAPRPFLIN